MLHPKILLCADLHLGRASAWLEGPDGVDRTATGAWRRIADIAIREEALAVAIAGDVFDGMAAYFETRKAFEAGVRALKAKGIPVVAVAGNHDHEALPRFSSYAPDCGLILLGRGGRWETVQVAGISFLGWSFPRESHRTSAFDDPLPSLPDGYVVGLLHGDIDPKSIYHPLSSADLETSATAWVLGHIHLPARVGTRAVYPGSPQALDFGPGERGAHGFYWLTLRDGRGELSELQPISTVRFEEAVLTVEVDAEEDPWIALREATEAHARTLREVQPNLESVQLRIRAVLEGCVQLGTSTTEAERSLDRSDAFLFTEVRIRPVRSPWDDVGSRDLSGEIARLLLGASADEDGTAEGLLVNGEWIDQVEALIDKAVLDVMQTFRVTVARASDAGDGARPAPDASDARRTAREALIAELEALRS